MQDPHATGTPNPVAPIPGQGPPSWSDSTGFHSFGSNPIANTIWGGPQPNQPGVGGPAKDPTRLVRDPTTGLYFDPTTGTTYTDGTGQRPVTDPNVAQQVSTNYSRSNAFNNQLTGLNQEREQVFGNQEQLGQSFRDIISGRATSPASLQAHMAMQNIANEQLAQTAGIGGASAPLAAMAAARNTGSASIGANNQATLARVQEQRAAEDAYNNLLNAQGMGVERAAGRTTGAGEDYAQLAATGQAGQQGLDAATIARNKLEEGRRGDSVGKFLTGLLPFPTG